jgi:hypothetical protein
MVHSVELLMMAFCLGYFYNNFVFFDLILKDVIQISDKTREISLSMSYTISWLDCRISTQIERRQFQQQLFCRFKRIEK